MNQASLFPFNRIHPTTCLSKNITPDSESLKDINFWFHTRAQISWRSNDDSPRNDNHHWIVLSGAIFLVRLTVGCTQLNKQSWANICYSNMCFGLPVSVASNIILLLIHCDFKSIVFKPIWDDLLNLNKSHFQLLTHSPYSPDLTPGDFRPHKNARRNKFGSNEEEIAETEVHFSTTDNSFYKKPIEMLEKKKNFFLHWLSDRLFSKYVINRTSDVILRFSMLLR